MVSWIKILLLILSLVIVSCSNGEKPSELILDFNSYSSFDQVAEKLKEKGGDWEVVENSSLQPGDGRPSFDVLVMRATGITPGLDDGVLLSFFNDQLLGVTFFASGLEESYSILEDLIGKEVKIEHGISEMINPNVKLSANQYPDGTIKITLEDIRLSNKKWAWIKKYS